VKHFFCHISFGKKEAHAKEVMKASLERLSRAVKRNFLGNGMVVERLRDVYLKTKIVNIETNKSITLNLLVDPNAAVTVIPENKLKAIGIKPLDKIELTLADGRTIVRDVGVAEFEIKGEQQSVQLFLAKLKMTLFWALLFLKQWDMH